MQSCQHSNGFFGFDPDLWYELHAASPAFYGPFLHSTMTFQSHLASRYFIKLLQLTYCFYWN